MMRKVLLTISCATLMAMTPVARAGLTSVPGLISAPVALYDDGGNVLPDGEYGVTLTLKGADGEILFEERQDALVVNGVAALTIGAGEAVETGGSSGGLSNDIFLASEEVTVEIAVDGLPIVQEIAVFGSQPYAFISDYALRVAPDAVSGESIRDGSVTANDLEPSFLASLQASPFQDLASDDDGGEAAIVLTADSVAVSSDSTFDNSSAATVEGVLRDLDAALASLFDMDFQNALTGVESTIEAYEEAASGVHGIVGDVVGTSDVQAISNKTLDGTNSISGSALNNGIVAESYIADEIARDAELTFSGLGGSISDNQIPSSIARDEELTFSGLTGSISDEQIPSSIARDVELTFSGLSGSISDEQIPSSIARDSELAFSGLSGSISDSQIPSSMTRDSELTFSGLSGSISDSQIPSSITRDAELTFSGLSGSISDSQIPSTIVRDSELAFSGLSGSISDSQIPSSIARDSELAFSNLSGSASASQIPSSLKPFAYGTLSSPSGGTCSGYNVDSDCTFTTNPSDSSYYVAITALGSMSCGSYAGACYVSSKSVSSFSVSCQCPSGGSISPRLDFMVFHQ
jgi:hypothetical protein